MKRFASGFGGARSDLTAHQAAEHVPGDGQPFAGHVLAGDVGSLDALWGALEAGVLEGRKVWQIKADAIGVEAGFNGGGFGEARVAQARRPRTEAIAIVTSCKKAMYQ